ncbi:hypothetical protein [Bryobacter aggregatus]|nr:hypothetical protein [Bryobacter aggregatus]
MRPASQGHDRQGDFDHDNGTLQIPRTGLLVCGTVCRERVD